MLKPEFKKDGPHSQYLPAGRAAFCPRAARKLAKKPISYLCRPAAQTVVHVLACEISWLSYIAKIRKVCDFSTIHQGSAGCEWVCLKIGYPIPSTC